MKTTTEPSFLSDLKQECILWSKGIALLFTTGFIPGALALAFLIAFIADHLK